MAKIFLLTVGYNEKNEIDIYEVKEISILKVLKHIMMKIIKSM